MPDHEADDEHSGNMGNSHSNQQTMQVKYLESENTNLQLENDDLNTTLKINKNIIKSILQEDKKFDDKVDYTLTQIN